MLQHLPEDLPHLEAVGVVFLAGSALSLAAFLLRVVL
jgi:hypothetical protein